MERDRQRKRKKRRQRKHKIIREEKGESLKKKKKISPLVAILVHENRLPILPFTVTSNFTVEMGW